MFRQQRFTPARRQRRGSRHRLAGARLHQDPGREFARELFGAGPEQQVIEVAHGCPSWVFINAGADGYFRTAYAPEMLRAMAPEIETARPRRNG